MNLRWIAAIALAAACSDDSDSVDNKMATDVRMDVGQDTSQDADVTSDADVEPGRCDDREPEVLAPAIRTPRWAFEPWISKDISDAADTYQFVDGFIERQIPVGVVVLDSPWETHYNTFIPNPVRYPDFGKMVSDMKERDVRVVLWVTQMVNDVGFDLEQGGDSYVGAASNFEEGATCGFYVNEGAKYSWWKGRGSGVDFFNPSARAWWHQQQSALLDMGVAGWKLDFGESYITTQTLQTAEGPVSHQQYSEAYYRDFWRYGAAKLGTDEFVTMVRGYDKSYQFEGRFFATPDSAPVVWAGDNRRDWIGLEDALDHMFRSAQKGYVVVGSDLGGYLDRDDLDLTVSVPASRTNFLRWTAASALSPFMQLHGRANLTPWTFPDDENPEDTVAVYRYWASLHHELVPFMFSLAEEGFKDFTPILAPVGDESSWPGDRRYTLGSKLLVAPILDDTGIRDVVFPAGTWWDPWTGEEFRGTVNFDISDDFKKALVFAAEGAIVPMSIDSEVTGIGDADLSQSLAVLIFPGSGAFVVHDTITATITSTQVGTQQSVNVPDFGKDVWLRLVAPSPTSVTVDGAARTMATSREAAGLGGYVQDGNFVWLKVTGMGEVVIK